MSPPKKIIRSEGITTAERYLQKLCERSFLSMWSYAGVYRDQGKEGKEICDLLVVFDEHIIIFSDKDCEFPDTGDLELDWNRWYRKAIKKSEDQVYGAERWLLTHPNRIFLDKSCKIPFPFELPSVEKAKIHRIVVAHSVSERCIKELGGSGSLMIWADREEIAHLNIPFAVKQGNPAKGFVHVFDDTTLDIVLNTLDTISDFVSYLTKKEEVLSNGTVIQAAGEEELLAFYMVGVDENKNADFMFKNSLPDVSSLVLTEGVWELFSQSPQRMRQLEANKISYFWDNLIEAFNKHAFDGTSYYNYPEGIDNQERILRFMARENRFRRRVLSDRLLDLIRKTPRYTRTTRTMLPSSPEEPYYVFFLFPLLSYMKYEDYRELRRRLLEDHCMITRLNYPDAQHIVGIATESGRTGVGSEDIVYYDASEWDEDTEEEVKIIKAEMIENEMLGAPKSHQINVKDYPDSVSPASASLSSGNFEKMKGRNRNLSCPCGSGRKYKKCHGN